ncbi:glycosyltransferase family 39 protein [Nocardia sp. NPDC005978]|uniref:glycosyltransferase family 39 protein n=1 Tax=Nocardia sp. NPDC005978 TaxID=3156725 RepID=UPI0033A8BA99
MTETGVRAEVAARPDSGESRWAAMISTPEGSPRWERPALAALLAGTAVLYLWGLGGAGWTNQYYAAAVQSGTLSWKALLFASLDPQNAITVDKPPAALWVMGLSGRLFGFGSWSMLAPQALMGVAAVGLLVAAVRRWSGPAAGLLAGLALALTPVAAMMFRYDNPDALLTLLLVAAAYCTVRAIDAEGVQWFSASTGWLTAAGVLMGLGFLTKMMQAFLVLPGLALVVLVAGAGGFVARLLKLLTAAAAVVLSAGWYVALVAWWPADSRPYIGGSSDNSLWELAMDYNGLGRVFGNGGARPAMPSPPAGGEFAGGFQGFGSQAGLTRLFTGELATEFSWLLPAALLALVAGVWLTRRAPRTDRQRAALVLWGGWLLITAAVLSYMSRSFHSYYSVELAPAIGALCGIGVTLLWSRRADFAARLTLAAMALGTGLWTFHLLDRTPDWLPWLRWSLLALAALTAAALLSAAGFRRAGIVIGAAAVITGLLGPTAYAVETVAQPHSGGSPLAGPPRAARGPMRAAPATDPLLDDLLTAAGTRWAAAAVGASDVSAIELRTGAPLLAVGGFSGHDGAPTLAQFQRYVAGNEIGYYLVRQRGGDERGRNGGDAEGSEAANAAGPAGNGAGGTRMNRVERSAPHGPGAAGENAPGPESAMGGSQSMTRERLGPARPAAEQSDSAAITAWVRANFPVTVLGDLEVFKLTG